MKKLIFPFAWTFLMAAMGCGDRATQQPEKERPLTSYFKKLETADTLRFEISEVTEELVGDTVPNRLFFSQIETRLMNHIDYFDNSGPLTVMSRGHFPLSKNIEAYHVDMRQSWYQHQSLFLFDHQQNKFTERVTVAEFFGGDGGQLLTGSYLLDYDGDGDKDLVRREIEHWIVMAENDDVIENIAERGTLLLWESNDFEEAEADSAALVKGFPIWSFW